ncbi:MAG: BatD family protein, partial [Bacteroidales bacterium]|nr:BatD family protein [Bacteroidales bacterium]
MKQIIIILNILFLSLNSFAQDVQFRVSAPNVVRIGQQFRLTYSVNTKPSDFIQPNFTSEISILAGPSTSTSSNISIVNGNMQQSYNLSYTYIAQFNKEGTFEILPAKIIVDKKKYASEKLKIKVIKSSDANQTNTNNNTNTEIPKSETDDLFVRILTNKTSVYKDEPILVTIKMYTKLQIAGIENVKFPNFNGFMMQDIETPQLKNLKREEVNGEIYGTGVLKKYLIFPQQIGKQKITPFSMECIYQKKRQGYRRSVFDDFFDNYQNLKTKVESKAKFINVKELPKNKPTNYEGAVGNFKLNTSLNKNKVKENDAITLKVKISGNGNLKYISPISINFPPDFETYDPKEYSNITNSENGSVGSKTFEYLIIPRHQGEYTIPAIKFSYFNPLTGKYKTSVSKNFKVIVEKGEVDSILSKGNIYSKEKLQLIGRDIRFIKNRISNLQAKNEFLISKKIFQASYIITLIFFVIFLLLRKKSIKQNKDIRLMRNKKANKYARKRLRKTRNYLKENEKEKFYEELISAIWGYLSDKLGISIANLSKENVNIKLLDKDVPNELINNLLQIIDTCEYARYAPINKS